jgi:hypothetical protein
VYFWDVKIKCKLSVVLLFEITVDKKKLSVTLSVTQAGISSFKKPEEKSSENMHYL